MIFPEGTRVASGNVVALQPGIVALAAHTRLPVLPVATDSGGCWPRGALGKRAGTVHIAVAPPITPEQLAGRPRAALLHAIRAAWSSEEARISHLRSRDNLVDNSVGGVSTGV